MTNPSINIISKYPIRLSPFHPKLLEEFVQKWSRYEFRHILKLAIDYKQNIIFIIAKKKKNHINYGGIDFTSTRRIEAQLATKNITVESLQI